MRVWSEAAKGDRTDIDDSEPAACCLFCGCHLYHNFFPYLEWGAPFERRAYKEDYWDHELRLNSKREEGSRWLYDPPYPLKHWNVGIAKRCSQYRAYANAITEGARI